MDSFRTNFFGSFLDTMKAPEERRREVGSSLQPNVASGPSAGSLLDELTGRLLASGGRAAFNDLLPETGYSIDLLADAVNRLQSLGLVRHDSDDISLTEAGTAAARARMAATTPRA